MEAGSVVLGFKLPGSLLGNVTPKSHRIPTLEVQRLSF